MSAFLGSRHQMTRWIPHQSNARWAYYSDWCQVTTFPFNSHLLCQEGLGHLLSNVHVNIGQGSLADEHVNPDDNFFGWMLCFGPSELYINLRCWDKRYKAYRLTWALSNPDVPCEARQGALACWWPIEVWEGGVMEESSDDCFSDSRYNDTMRPESWEHCEHFRELHTISK